MTPPPTVRLGDGRRMMKRSPGATATGDSSTSCAQPPCAGRQLLRIEQPHAGGHLGRAAEEVHLVAVFEAGLHPGDPDEAEPNVDHRGWLEGSRPGDHHAAAQIVRMDAGQVDGEPAARKTDLHGPLVRLHAAHARLQAGGQDLDFVAHPELAVAERPRDDGAESRDGEDAVDGQAGRALVTAGRDGGERVGERLLELGQPGPGAGGDGHDGGAGELRAAERFGHVGLDQAPASPLRSQRRSW